MSEFLQFVFLLAVILVSAKTAGYLSTRLGQPSVLGELVIGLILGPSLVDIVHLPWITSQHLGEFIIELGEMGVLLLMFLAGLELHLSELAGNVRVAAYAGTLGVLFPLGLGWVTGSAFGFSTEQAIFLGLILGATSVSISAQTLLELDALRSRVGLGLLGAAVFDDILVILFLSTFLAVTSGTLSLASLALILARMFGFFGLSFIFGMWVLPRLTERVSRLSISQGTVSLALVVMITYALAAELLGSMAAITGAFISGLMLGRTPLKMNIERGIHALAYGLLVPVFFVSIGLGMNLRELQAGAVLLLVMITLAAIAGKLLGAGIGAFAGGFSWRESIQLGAGMISRGEVGLIVASVGMRAGLVSAEVFSTIVGTILVTTIVTPLLLRSLFTVPAREKTRQPQTAGASTSPPE